MKTMIRFSILLSLFLAFAGMNVACTSDPNDKEQVTDGGNTDGGKTFQKLSADGYTTVSDVNSHNKVAKDIWEINQLLGASPIDWSKVQQMYEKGKHSVKGDGSVRTLNGFASAPDNFKKYSPDAVAYFKTNGICQLAPIKDFKCTEGKFLDELVEFYAMNGKGPFAKATDADRAAVVSAGLLVNMHYWVRLEFGKALGKAKDGTYEPLEGAPHNWDEAFAFYWGPDGKYSLYTLADNLSKKYSLSNSVNKEFFEALIDGLKVLVDDKKEPTAAIDKAQRQLDRLFLLAVLDAAKEMDAAKDDAARAVARWKGYAYWHAIAHLIHKADVDADKAMKDVFFTGKTTKDFAAAVQKVIKDNLSKLGFEEGDFGTALQ